MFNDISYPLQVDIPHCNARLNLLKQITQMKKNKSEADILIQSEDQNQ
jgi:hypothetical protein